MLSWDLRWYLIKTFRLRVGLTFCPFSAVIRGTCLLTYETGNETSLPLQRFNVLCEVGDPHFDDARV